MPEQILFFPDETYEKALNRKIAAYPYRPLYSERATCGPAVLAAVLGVSMGEAIDLMDEHYRPKGKKGGWHGYTNVGHIRAGLEARELKLVKLDMDDLGIPAYQHPEHEELAVVAPPLDFGNPDPVLVFSEFLGPWTDKGWRSQYNRTHWSLIHAGYVLDINNGMDEGGCVVWISIVDWLSRVMTDLALSYYEECTGWKFRAIYKVVEP